MAGSGSATVIVERTDGALLMRAREAEPTCRGILAALTPEPFTVPLVVDPSATAALARPSSSLVDQIRDHLHVTDAGSPSDVRLIAARAARGGPDGAPAPAAVLADLLSVQVIAPDGALIALRGGELFSAGDDGGWLAFRRGWTPQWQGPRHPAPTWQETHYSSGWLPSVEAFSAGPAATLAGRLSGTPIPAGIWVRSAGGSRKPLSDLGFGVPVDRNRPLLLVGAPGEPVPSADELAGVVSSLSEGWREHVVLAPYGCAGSTWVSLVQALADRLGAPVRAHQALPYYAVDGARRLAELDRDGRPSRLHNAEEITRQPSSVAAVVSAPVGFPSVTQVSVGPATGFEPPAPPVVEFAARADAVGAQVKNELRTTKTPTSHQLLVDADGVLRLRRAGRPVEGNAGARPVGGQASSGLTTSSVVVPTASGVSLPVPVPVSGSGSGSGEGTAQAAPVSRALALAGVPAVAGQAGVIGAGQAGVSGAGQAGVIGAGGAAAPAGAGEPAARTATSAVAESTGRVNAVGANSTPGVTGPKDEGGDVVAELAEALWVAPHDIPSAETVSRRAGAWPAHATVGERSGARRQIPGDVMVLLDVASGASADPAGIPEIGESFLGHDYRETGRPATVRSGATDQGARGVPSLATVVPRLRAPGRPKDTSAPVAGPAAAPGPDATVAPAVATSPAALVSSAVTSASTIPTAPASPVTSATAPATPPGARTVATAGPKAAPAEPVTAASPAERAGTGTEQNENGQREPGQREPGQPEPAEAGPAEPEEPGSDEPAPEPVELDRRGGEAGERWLADRVSTPVERQVFRTSLGWRYDSHAKAVARMLAESPGLRVTSSVDEALVTELAAVRALSEKDRDEFVRSARTGCRESERPMAVCASGGLRRLPTFEGVVLRGGPADPAALDDYRVGDELCEVAPLVALDDPEAELGGPVEVLIWSVTARRVAGLVDTERAGDLMFQPGTGFRVLEVDPAGREPVRRVLLAEVPPGRARPQEATARITARLHEVVRRRDERRTTTGENPDGGPGASSTGFTALPGDPAWFAENPDARRSVE
ncbi:hypothetical protein KIH74_14755 [Kineosporia sp. J2-2]|uniref:Uncharacterized protein n=1 Tax=Kineosporia corallincola TaxID=2835133 RepID=A0ABS5TH59_9ACTN|nr:hypothetical protein [Kineosporia corallincola]MBT0770198.1 hypothetical protein [Kineosporia corallincola]